MTSNEFKYADFICKNAYPRGQRMGQYLFNNLPDEAASVVRGTFFDPFNKVQTRSEVIEWVENHLIIDGNEIVGVFNRNQILWESPTTLPVGETQ